MSYYKADGKVKHSHCRYCGARLGRDAIGQHCTTQNCQWEHGLPGLDDTPTIGAKRLMSDVEKRRKESRKTIRDKVIEYTVAEQKKAEAEQRRLQAAADLRARKEQEALLAKAASAKKTDTQTKYQEAAAAVAAPTIVVAAPKTTMRGVAK